MTNENQINDPVRPEDPAEKDPPESGAISVRVVESPELVAPPEVDAVEAAEMKSDAAHIVELLRDSEGSAEMELEDELSNIGVNEQSATAREMELLKVRLGAIMADEGAGSQIGRDMADLRVSLDELKPSSSPGGSILGRAIKALPVANRLVSPIRSVKKIALRYEPVSKQVAAIETRLRDGRRALVQDNVELRQLYVGVEQQRPSVIRGTYFGELVMQELEEAIAQEEDATKAERMRTALHDVSIRVQDLKTMNEVTMQYLVSIEMSRQNNVRLSQSVDRTLALGSNIVMVGLAIQVALSRQKRVMEANQRTREFLGGVITANAEAIKQHTAEIGDVYNSPVVAVEMVTRAHADLIDAIDTARQLRVDGVRQAKDNMNKLDALMTQGGPVLAAALPEPESGSGSRAVK